MRETERKKSNGSNGTNPIKKVLSQRMNPEDREAIIREFLKAAQEDTGATFVLNGNGNGSKNLIFNSILVQTTDKETSDLIIDKIKGLSNEAFEEILLTIASQIKERNKDDKSA